MDLKINVVVHKKQVEKQLLLQVTLPSSWHLMCSAFTDPLKDVQVAELEVKM